MSSVYAPGSRRSRGKLYRPSASVVTLTWTIDLARRAVTTTPSILPSASELTIPVSADCSSAWTASIRGGKTIAAAVAASASISLFRIGLSRRKLVVAVSRLDSPVLGSVDRYGILPHLTPGVERRRGDTDATGRGRRRAILAANAVHFSEREDISPCSYASFRWFSDWDSAL